MNSAKRRTGSSFTLWCLVMKPRISDRNRLALSHCIGTAQAGVAQFNYKVNSCINHSTMKSGLRTPHCQNLSPDSVEYGMEVGYVGYSRL
jgi:hypothetical protein